MLVTPMAEFIKFDATRRIVSWETSNNLYAGDYTIQIFGALNSFKNSITFMLEVNVVQVISSPVLLGLSSF
jgi:hypothetical protein